MGHFEGSVLGNRRLLGGLLAGVMVFAMACNNDGVNTPVSPTSAAGDAGRHLSTGSNGTSVVGVARLVAIQICHRTEGAREWVPMSVPPPAAESLIAHGDVLVGGAVPGQPGMKFDADCNPVRMVQVTITFAGLSGNGSPVTTYSESGFTVLAVSGNWQALTTYGHPAPSLIFMRAATDPTTTAEVRITAGGDIFSFTSVDLYSSVTPIPYVFTGMMGSTTAFTVTGTVPNTFGNFVTVANPNSTALIDALLIRLSNPATPCCSNPVGFDNVVLVH
jgi:hypothetical protein